MNMNCNSYLLIPAPSFYDKSLYLYRFPTLVHDSNPGAKRHLFIFIS